MDYLTEIETIQTWVKAVAGINSYRLKEAKPKVARPVILWEAPGRLIKTRLSLYVYVYAVRQYGRLFVKDLDAALEIQEKLVKDLEAKAGVLPIVKAGLLLGHFKAVEIEFDTSESLDMAFNVSYEVTYGNTRPAEAPNATYVGTTVVSRGAEITKPVEFMDGGETFDGDTTFKGV